MNSHKKIKIKISNRLIGEDFKPLIIAELGINHGGSLIQAKKLVDAAQKAGAEIIKHQTHVVEDEMTDTHSDIEITVTGADEDGDGVLSEDELKKLTKAKLESVARDYGIEIDRRKSKKALLEELLEKIA